LQNKFYKKCNIYNKPKLEEVKHEKEKAKESENQFNEGVGRSGL